MPKRLFGFALILVLAGCASVYNPATQREEFIFIDSIQEVQIGRSMAERIITKEHELLNSPPHQLLVHKVGQRIVGASDRREIVYHFMVLDHVDLNAFALPGGYIYIYSGLLERLDEAGLAAILAHEVSHVAARHSVKKMQSVLGYNLLVGLVLAGFGKDSPALAQQISDASGVVFSLLSRGYGRQDELLADRLAVKYLARAGYDPAALIDVLRLLKEEHGPGGRVFEVLSTHPRLKERIRKIREAIQLLGRSQEAGQN